MSSPAAATKQRTVTRLRSGEWTERGDTLVVEEPLEIRLGSERFTVTMRTPGDDFALTRGLLLTEGLISSNADIGQIRYCDTGEAAEADIPNIVTVRLNKMPAAERLWQRTLMAGTSCGLCGKAALDAVANADRTSALTLFCQPQPGNPAGTAPISCAAVKSSSNQPAASTPSACSPHPASALCAYEDIGRHNATDKAIGCGVEQGWLPWANPEPLTLLVSGRASFEITQKALMARIPVVCSISAASSLAADLAELNNQTLVGFLRDTGMTVYAGQERIGTHPGSSLADPPETGR